MFHMHVWESHKHTFRYILLSCCCCCRRISFSLYSFPPPALVDLSGCAIISSIIPRLGFSQPYLLRGNQNCSVDWSNRTRHTKLSCDSLSGRGLFEHLNVAEGWRGDAHAKRCSVDVTVWPCSWRMISFEMHLYLSKVGHLVTWPCCLIFPILFSALWDLGGTLESQLKVTGNDPSQCTTLKYVSNTELWRSFSFSAWVM